MKHAQRAARGIASSSSRTWPIFGVLFICSLQAAWGQDRKPVYTYLNDASIRADSNASLTGPARVIALNGRTGLNLTSIHSVLELKQHTLNKRQGTVSLWFMPLEDLSSFDPKASMSTSNKNWVNYTFLSDAKNPQDFDSGNFKLTWVPRWTQA